MSWRLAGAGAAALAVLIIIIGGCASGTGARPAAFPGAPAPPGGLRPPGLAAPRAPGVPALIHTAFGLRGTRYRYGGESPGEGFDCSGFIRYVFGANRLDVPRTVGEQYEWGSAVGRDGIEKGDLIFFTTIAPGASHVGLAIGDGAFIHAPGDGGAVRVDRLDAPYWQTRIVGVRRVL
jgi:cell wall-associated NlpC family hydrolase